MSVLLGRAARHYWCRSRCSSVLGLSGIRQHSPAPLSYTCDQYQWIRVDMSTVGGGRGGADIVAGKRAAAYKAVDECVKVVESRDVCVCMLVNDTMILQDGQRLGIGSGSTIVFAVDRIGQCIKCKHALSCDSHVRTCIVM